MNRTAEEPRFRNALRMLAGGTIVIGGCALAASVTQQPFVFPSLGPTAVLLLVDPMRANASPRNAVIGHLVAGLCGYVALALFGLTTAESAMVAGVSLRQVLAAGLSVGIAHAVLELMGKQHAPAAATALMVSLGILTAPTDLLVVALAVVTVTVGTAAVNRLLGHDVPIWSPL